MMSHTPTHAPKDPAAAVRQDSAVFSAAPDPGAAIRQPSASLAGLPRLIWFHWAQGFDAMPRVARQCLASWELNNPEWKVVFVDRESIGQWLDMGELPVDVLRGTSEQVYANAVRLALLRRHGGVWVDATCWCRIPLSAWLIDSPGEFFAFANPGRDRVMANWFMASLPGGCIVQIMAHEYIRIFRNYGPLKAFAPPVVNDLMQRGCGADVFFDPFLLGRLKGYPYYLFHYLFDMLCRQNPAFSACWAASRKLSAGPGLEPGHVGLAQPLEENFRRRWADMNPPVFKLNWRAGETHVPGSVLAEILAGRV